MQPITLTLEATELCALLEALHEHLILRAKWTLQRQERQTPDGWAHLDLPIVQAVIDQSMNAYAKAMMALRDIPEEQVHPEFRAMVTPPPQLWDLMNEIGLARTWADVPTHEQHSNCAVCSQLAEV